MEIAAPKARKRLRFRLSLAVAMVGIALIAVCLAPIVNRARRQKEATALVLRAGGQIGYEHNYSVAQGSFVSGDPEPPGPRWLRNLVGAEYFQTVNYVNVSSHWGRYPNIDGFEFLDDLPSVRRLDVEFITIPAAWLVHVRPLRLTAFYAKGSTLDDDGLAQLSGMIDI